MGPSAAPLDAAEVEDAEAEAEAEVEVEVEAEAEAEVEAEVEVEVEADSELLEASCEGEEQPASAAVMAAVAAAPINLRRVISGMVPLLVSCKNRFSRFLQYLP